MKSFYVNEKNLPEELKAGIKAVSSVVPVSFEKKQGAVELKFRVSGGELSINGENGGIEISYPDVNAAFRALGILNARSGKELEDINIREKRHFTKTWVMVDFSRNAVMKPEAVSDWLVFMALSGINGLMFYTEDTYEVPGEELFGYMRGRYTASELKAVDDEAFKFGIEIIPCIQTLAHLQRVLRYPAYKEVTDTASVMFCGRDDTYKFIEKMLKAATAPLRSKRIHIGMDEAWDLGRGAYLSENGFVPPFEIMCSHLKRVMEIVRRLGLQPMMWSDMFFRALSETHNYYDTDIKVNEDVVSKIPDDVELVYWDYYHSEESDYDAMIRKHEEMNGIPIMAPGLQSWGRFWPCYEWAEKSLAAGLGASLKNGVEEIILTIWGDDGTECDFFATLPLMQYASDICFSGSTGIAPSVKNLRGTLGVNYEEWKLGAIIDELPFVEKGNHPPLSKMLLWEDLLIGLYQATLDGEKVCEHYRDTRDRLDEVVGKSGNERLRLPYLIADVLSVKGDLPTVIQEAYRTGDREKLRDIQENIIPGLLEKIRRLHCYHRSLWLANNKPFGWEVLERRYGGLESIVEYATERIKAYLAGEIDVIDELEEKKVKMGPGFGGKGAGHVYSTGYIFHNY